MLLREYRICLPFSLEEFRVGRVFMVARGSLESTEAGEGIEVLDNSPAVVDGEYGRRTHKRVHVGDQIPSWALRFLPADSLYIDEIGTTVYPHSMHTEYDSPLLGGLTVTVDTVVLGNDRGGTENALGLADDELASREVEVLDIADPSQLPAGREPDPEFDPRTLRVDIVEGGYGGVPARVVGFRGPLDSPTWSEELGPMLCVYKVCRVHYSTRIPGLGGRIERFVHRVALRDIFFMSHLNAYCWASQWMRMSYAVVRKMETDIELFLRQTFEPGYIPEMEQDGLGTAVDDAVVDMICDETVWERGSSEFSSGGGGWLDVAPASGPGPTPRSMTLSSSLSSLSSLWSESEARRRLLPEAPLIPSGGSGGKAGAAQPEGVPYRRRVRVRRRRRPRRDAIADGSAKVPTPHDGLRRRRKKKQKRNRKRKKEKTSAAAAAAAAAKSKNKGKHKKTNKDRHKKKNKDENEEGKKDGVDRPRAGGAHATGVGLVRVRVRRRVRRRKTSQRSSGQPVADPPSSPESSSACLFTARDTVGDGRRAGGDSSTDADAGATDPFRTPRASASLSSSSSSSPPSSWSLSTWSV